MPRPREGDWFAVPLAGGGYAVGLVARAPKRGNTLFGYFFGPIHEDVPTPDDVRGYTAEDAVFVGKFFQDDAFVSGRWPIVLSSSEWDRSAWPMPEFHVVDSQYFAGESYAVRYSEDKPDRFIGRRVIPVEEESRYPPDQFFSDEGVERCVGEMLGAVRVDSEVTEPVAVDEEGVRYFIFVLPEAVEDLRRRLSELGLEDVEVWDDVDPEETNGRVSVVAFQRGDIGELRSSIDEMETKLTALARSVGGDYDGLEWSLG